MIVFRVKIKQSRKSHARRSWCFVLLPQEDHDCGDMTRRSGRTEIDCLNGFVGKEGLVSLERCVFAMTENW